MNVMIGLALLSQLADRMEPGNSRVPFPGGILSGDENRECVHAGVGGVRGGNEAGERRVVRVLDIRRGDAYIGRVLCARSAPCRHAGGLQRTGTVHADQRVRIPRDIRIVAANDDRAGPQPLRLAHLLHKLALSTLHERNPSFRWFGGLIARKAELGAAPILESGGVRCAGDREGGQGYDIAEDGLLDLSAKCRCEGSLATLRGGQRGVRTGSGRKSHRGRAVDDRDGALGAPRPSPEPALLGFGIEDRCGEELWCVGDRERPYARREGDEEEE